MAAFLVTGVWLHHPVVALFAVAAGMCIRRTDVTVCLAVVAVLGALLGRHAWHEVAPRHLGPYSGWATLADDPRPVASGLRVVVEVEGERFEAYVFGSVRRRLEPRQSGERILLDATRVELSTDFPRRSQARHVVGDLEIDRVWSHATGTPLTRASNRLRMQLRRGADGVMPGAEAALFAGLVIGDDSRQPAEMIDEFRAAGLSHLTAVSGQNLAFVLAAAGLGLRRLRPWWRLGATLAVIAWFAVITRLEPSVLRASCMAALSALAFAIGRERSAVRLLFVSVMILVAVDPLLVWSVGFWLSVSATFGVVAIAPALVPRLAGPRWWANALAVTLGAQLGVLVPSWLVFHRVPALGLPANLLAVPVAGLVMLYGLPAALVAALVPPPIADVLMAPATLGTRWVAFIARTVAHVQPSGAVAVVVWLGQLTLLALLITRRRPLGEEV